MANEVFANSVQTLQISTGNVQTVNDPFILSNLGQGQFGGVQGARNPLGQAAYVSDGTTTGRRWKVRYVRMNPTTVPGAYIVGPCYWLDETYQVVTTANADAAAGLNAVAGIWLNANATPSVITGNYGFILVNGLLNAANLVAGTAMVVGGAAGAGGLLLPAAGQQLTTSVASGTWTTTFQQLGYLTSAISGGKADVYIDLES